VIVMWNYVSCFAVFECVIVVCGRWKKINVKNREKNRRKKRKLQGCVVRCCID